MLKADLHIHTSEDPHDRIAYSAKQLIEYASFLGFDVISITNHNKVTFSKGLAEYAEKKGIVLIPGAELKIEGADVLVYNLTQKDAAGIKKLSDLQKLKKRKNVLIAAPHPYYVYRSLGRKLEKNISLFDAVEYCHFYLKQMNAPNKKAARVASKYGLPVIGNSDSHHLWRMNTTYTLISSKKELKSVISAIKKGRVKVVSTHLTLWKYLRAMGGTLWAIGRKKLSKQKK